MSDPAYKDKFSAEIQQHPFFPALMKEISRSPTLVSQLNSFPGRIEVGGDSNGVFFSKGLLPQDNKINFDRDRLRTMKDPQSVSALAINLAHELGHAMLPGGLQEPNKAKSPQEAVTLGLSAEGVAITNEYVVARELKARMQDERLQNNLDKVAKQNNLNTPAFRQKAEKMAAATYAEATASHTGMKYKDMFAYSWALHKVGGDGLLLMTDLKTLRASDRGAPSITFSPGKKPGQTHIHIELPTGDRDKLNISRADVDAQGQLIGPVHTSVAPDYLSPMNKKQEDFIQQTRKAVLRLCDEQGYPKNQGRENMVYALALAGLKKGMHSVDGAYTKDGNVTIGNHLDKHRFEYVTMDSKAAANASITEPYRGTRLAIQRIAVHEQDQQAQSQSHTAQQQTQPSAPAQQQPAHHAPSLHR